MFLPPRAAELLTDGWSCLHRPGCSERLREEADTRLPLPWGHLPLCHLALPFASPPLHLSPYSLPLPQTCHLLPSSCPGSSKLHRPGRLLACLQLPPILLSQPKFGPFLLLGSFSPVLTRPALSTFFLLLQGVWIPILGYGSVFEQQADYTGKCSP